MIMTGSCVLDPSEELGLYFNEGDLELTADLRDLDLKSQLVGVVFNDVVVHVYKDPAGKMSKQAVRGWK